MDHGSGNHDSSRLPRMHTGISILRVNLWEPDSTYFFLSVLLTSCAGVVAPQRLWCDSKTPCPWKARAKRGRSCAFRCHLAPDAKEWRNRIAQHQVALVGRDHHEHFSRATTSAGGWLRNPDLILQCGEFQAGMLLRQLASFLAIWR